MSASTAILSPGTTFALDPAAGTSYVALAQVRKIGGPGQKWTDIKTTFLGSASATHENQPGMCDPGEMTLDLLLTKADYNTLFSHKRTVMTWKLQWPPIGAESTGTNITGSGWLQELGPETPEDGEVTCTCKIRNTGPITFVQGS